MQLAGVLIMKKNISLDDLWQQIDKGLAGEQEKVDAAVLSGKSKDHRYVSHLQSLLNDEDGQVRYYALQGLVLGLQQKGDAMGERCWELLRQDPDEDVRGMAAACLGSIYFGTRSYRVFQNLLKELGHPEQSLRAKGTIYDVLFKIAGRPPAEWPSLQIPWKSFEEADIDWGAVARLEDQMDNP